MKTGSSLQEDDQTNWSADGILETLIETNQDTVIPALRHRLAQLVYQDGFPQGPGEDGMDDFRVKQFEKCKRPDQIACRPEKSAAFLFPRSRFPECQFFGDRMFEKN